MTKFDWLITATPPTPNGDLHSDIPGIEQHALSLQNAGVELMSLSVVSK